MGARGHLALLQGLGDLAAVREGRGEAVTFAVGRAATETLRDARPSRRVGVFGKAEGK